MNRFRSALILALASACAVAVPSAFARADDPALPPFDAGVAGVASTDDARALLVNPAAIGVRYPWEVLAGYRRLDPHHEWNTTLLTSGGAGFFALRTRDSSQTYGVAGGFGSDAMRMGMSAYRLVSNQPMRERTTDYAIGLLSRPAPWLSLGGKVDHLFEPKFRGERRQRWYDLGVGLRPLALSRPHAAAWGPRLTLTGDVRIVDDGDWGQARTWFGAELEPVPGFALEATLADHRNVRFGVTLRGTAWSAHGGGATEDGALLYRSYVASLHGGEERSVFALPAERRVAVVRAGGVLADEALDDVSLTGGSSTTSSRALRFQLERAAEDPLTRGVLLDLRHVGGMAQLEELRPRIDRLRQLGKPTLAYMEEGGGRGDLYLASACDRIVASEEAGFVGLGLRAERRYWREALANFGIRVERSSTGMFKSAYRNFSTDSMPPADSVVVLDDLDTRQRLFVDAVSQGRHLSRERLEGYLDGREWMPEDLRAGGVIDSIGYREDAVRMIGRMARLGDKPRTVNLRRRPPAQREWTRPARIAIVYASGGIELGASGNDLLSGPTLGSATLIAQLGKAFHAPGVKAVVFRIESPGGSALASNLIDHAVVRLMRETKKPLVVSMGSLAGSGGYYIACHADRIFADRHTRTGSIGVLTVQPSFEGLYRKLHAKQAEFDRGDYMRGTSWSRDWTPREQAAADSTILRLYRGFVGKVADGRHMTPEAVHAVAQGRVWLGDAAKERGLVDEIGGLDAAIAAARARAGVAHGEKIGYRVFGRPRGSLLWRLLGGAVRDAIAREMQVHDFDEARMVDPDVLAPITD